MEYYTVNLTILSMDTHRIIRKEHILFKSLYAAVYIAKLYDQCADVADVEVVDKTTGEVMYYHTADGGFYEAEL